MTNEEIAKKISNEYDHEDTRFGAYYGAKEMAIWKDEQFKDFLLKKLKVAEMDYDENYKIGSNSDKLICRVRKATISELIDELFK